MDKNIYSKLTNAAENALDETTREVIELIATKAYHKANQRNTADREISLLDIIEAKEEILYKRSNINKLESRRKRMALLLSMTGAVYSVFGILFYLYQNKTFDTTKDLGLIIAALGILVSITAFYFSLLMVKRKIELTKDNSIIERDNSEFEIVRRWQTIEKIGSDLMLKEGISDNRAKSFNFIISYLLEKLSDSSKENELRKLLIARNQIVHSNSENTFTKFEIEEMINIADGIIDELDKQIKSTVHRK